MIRRSLFQYSAYNGILPPTYLLPCRAGLFTIAHTTEIEPLDQAYHHTTTSTQSKIAQEAQPNISSPPPPPALRYPQLSRKSPLPPPSPVTTASLALLPSLAAQTPHYITAHIHAKPYLLTLGDSLRLPFLMPNAPVGSILRLTRATVLGSRDYTYRGAPWIDERAFVCRARVIGVESEPMRFIEKTKRRQRHVKTVKSKGRFTILRVCELRVLPNSPEPGVSEGTSVEGTDGELVEAPDLISSKGEVVEVKL